VFAFVVILFYKKNDLQLNNFHTKLKSFSTKTECYSLTERKLQTVLYS